MADGKKLIERKFLLEKKNIKLEDMKLYIEEYAKDEMKWFYDICVNEQPLEKDGKETGEKGVLPFLTIKKKFYDKFFPQDDERSKRMKLFSDWNIDE